MNKEERIKEYAHKIWMIRQKHDLPGTPESDWEDAELRVKIEDRAVEYVNNNNDISNL